MKTLQTTLMALGLSVFATPSMALTQACDVVAKKSGAPYQTQNSTFASKKAPGLVEKVVSAELKTRLGQWYIYQSNDEVFAKDKCAPMRLQSEQGEIDVTPVLWNQMAQRYAVIRPVFLVKAHQASDLTEVMKTFNLTEQTMLPDSRMGLFEIPDTESYDDLVENMNADSKILFAAPMLSEQRYRLR